ncbi:plasmid replication protein RepC [Sedimentitalea todarodis]|uniref:Plasmid replication protein RepC n=1 Tax=Sedimentitalea todarodis TaxID=1631240 RepID=A0ABU3VKH9_9RHOB|nr:plasmid replication protein RepC [Sedimentitalea todarodis]MDU9006680.1 plasmid replication protein RepC [Sedimentitalea todarodis]
MAFTKLSIKSTGTSLATGTTPPPETDIWAVFRALRDSRTLFGLRPGHVQTLQAMLSFLKPGHGEIVFASNHEICRRVGGIDERTLRRHIDRFVGAGFLRRHDSPNGKRYRVRSSKGHCISYGLSLAPLFERASELLAVAQELENTRRDRIFVRKQILTRLAQLEEFDPDSAFPSDVRRTLRRKLTLAEYRVLLAQADAEHLLLSTAVDAPESIELPANDGQTVRHHSKSIKEQKDLESRRSIKIPELQTLTSVCNQATSFASDSLESWHDVENHARTLAPMMGIHSSTFENARNAVGTEKVSCAIFIMLQLGSKIRNFGAYFHSITLGRREPHFDPTTLLQRLSRSGSAIV